MGAYQDDREWADQYEDQLKAIIASLLVKSASFRRDTREATDLIVHRVTNGPRAGQAVGAIASRIRRPGNFWNRSFNSRVFWGLQFTIRSRRSNGVETELKKIVEDGFGDWFIYGHIEQELLRHWMVLDLEVFRAHINDPLLYKEEQDNKDGTFFTAYSLRSFPDNILIGASDTIKIALREGVPAVPQLPVREQPSDFAEWLNLNPEPNLQKLAVQYGGAGRIPADVWQQFDRGMESWRARYRLRAIGSAIK